MTATLRTRYEFLADAESDGWRRVNRSIDVDVSGGNWVGYEFKALDGQFSRTIVLSQESNKLGSMWGYCLQMFRTTTPPNENHPSSCLNT